MTFKKINFNIHITSCCGILNIEDFAYDEGSYGWLSHRDTARKATTYASKEIQFEDIEKNYVTKLFDCIVEDGHYKGGQYLLQASMVSKYYNPGVRVRETPPQCPEMEEFLMSKGFKVAVTWKNHNTGNTLKLFQKKLTNKEIRDLYKSVGRFYPSEGSDDENDW